MRSNKIRLSIVLALVILSGCKLSVMVSSGGDVTSASGTRNCIGPATCEFEVTDATFTETFTAVPKPGYVFEKWIGGSNYQQCADSVNPVCVLSNTNLAGNVLEPFIPGGWIYHLTPLFTSVGLDTDGDGQEDYLDEDDDNDGIPDVSDPCRLDLSPSCGPITDTVVTGGKRWAQVDLFVNLSWNEINAVCSVGECTDGGSLNDYDMTGWVWASVEDTNSLIYPYLGEPSPLDPAQHPFYLFLDLSNSYTSQFGVFFGDFRKLYTDQGCNLITGWAQRTLATGIGQLVEVVGSGSCSGNTYNASFFSLADSATSSTNIGAWFYKPL